MSCEYLDDNPLVAAFDALAIAPRDYGHREHVRIAFALLARHDFLTAAGRFRAMVLRFADSIGASGKYHETITMAYLAMIAERMHGAAYADSRAFLSAQPELLDHRNGALADHYDVEAITASTVARAVFVLPKRR